MIGASIIAMNVRCSEPPGPSADQRAVATPSTGPSASQPTSQPTATTPTTTQADSEPERVTRIVLSDDGRSVEAEFPSADDFKLPWIEAEELLDPTQPGRVSAQQRPPRTIDIDTHNIRRLRINFPETQLSSRQRIILRIDGGRGLDVSQSESRTCRLIRTPTGRWLRDFGPVEPDEE